MVEAAYCTHLKNRSPWAEAGGSKPGDSGPFQIASEIGYPEAVRNCVTVLGLVAEIEALTGGPKPMDSSPFKQLQKLMVQVVIGLPLLLRILKLVIGWSAGRLLKLVSV